MTTLRDPDNPPQPPAKKSRAGSTTLEMRICRHRLNPDGTLGEVEFSKDGAKFYLTMQAARAMGEQLVRLIEPGEVKLT